MEAASLALALGLGGVVGLSLALTGSGGTAFAVPLLVYGLRLSPHRAVCVSMAAIGVTAALATVQKLRLKQIDLRAALVLAVSGAFGAPTGAWIGRSIPENWLLVLFAALVLLVGIRMSFRSSTALNDLPSIQETEPRNAPQVKGASSLILLSVRSLGLAGAGLFTGLLAGLLGVGGGFVLVPILVFASKLEIHRAVATSSSAIAFISIPAFASHLLAGQTIPPGITMIFIVGAILGLMLGSKLATRLSALRLQRLFGVTMLIMAILLLLHNFKWS